MENEERRTNEGRRLDEGRRKDDRGHHVHPDYKWQQRRIMPKRRTQKDRRKSD